LVVAAPGSAEMMSPQWRKAVEVARICVARRDGVSNDDEEQHDLDD